MPFNLSFDSTVGAVQQAALLTVANFFNAHLTDPVTIDISVSFANLGRPWGELVLARHSQLFGHYDCAHQ